MKVTNHDLRKLLGNGWQSWSYKSFLGDLFKFPPLNYPPTPNNDFSHLDLSYDDKLKPPIRGWCSWYAYGHKINQENILKQANYIVNNNEFNLDVILIDGGWCRNGDWNYANLRKFPEGMGGISSEIKKLGLTPGIWISPFQAAPGAKIVKEHPDWFVKEKGNYIDSLKLTPFDRHFSYRHYLLDVTKEEVQRYIFSVFDMILGDWKYEVIKLDFLYSIYFNPTLSAEEADMYLRMFLKYIKDNYPDAYTIACGCPLIPAVGLVDSMRVGPDSLLSPFLHFSSKSRFLDVFIHRKVIQTVESRLWTRKFWNIDPDSFVCRRAIGHTGKMIRDSIELVKESKGNTLLGDDLTRLPQSRVNRYIRPLFQ